MPEIRNQYQLVFTYDGSHTSVSAVSPLLSYYLTNSGLTQGTELYNAIKYYTQYGKSAEQDVLLTRAFTVKMIGTEGRLIYNDPENALEFPETVLVIPADDLIAVLDSWIAFLTPYKVRNVEVKNGQGVIDIISDEFATALMIGKAVASIWPGLCWQHRRILCRFARKL